MKVIVPTNTVPNSMLIQDVIPSKGIIIVYRDQMPYGFVVYSEEEQLFFLQTDTMSTTGVCGYTISDLLEDIKHNVSGDISLEYFVTADE